MKLTSCSDEIVDVVRDVFKILHDGYSGRFPPTARLKGESPDVRRDRSRQAAEAWAKAFMVVEKLPAELRYGAKRCVVEMKFPDRITPADVLQRAELRPEQVGMPPALEAFNECLGRMFLSEEQRISGSDIERARGVHGWSHPAIEAAFRRINIEMWRGPTRPEKLWEWFQPAYADVVRQVARGRKPDELAPRSLKRQPQRPTVHELWPGMDWDRIESTAEARSYSQRIASIRSRQEARRAAAS